MGATSCSQNNTNWPSSSRPGVTLFRQQARYRPAPQARVRMTASSTSNARPSADPEVLLQPDALEINRSGLLRGQAKNLHIADIRQVERPKMSLLGQRGEV